ncbi:MAG: polysulfide reductase NrfD [Candidatus Latescibacterota bacterium]|nr:MAG: polysulfide reductase NrfD [Candidatus Latescibacterota bacterium]
MDPVETTTTRANPLIDPQLHIWHGEVALYLFLGGLAAGIMIITGAMRLRDRNAAWSSHLALLSWCAPLLLSLGMFFLWLDLENPFNALRFYATFSWHSPMSWGAWILLLVFPVSILFAWTQTRRSASGRLARFDAWAREREAPLAAWNVAGGVALGLYTGILLASLAARPLWNSALLGPLFLVSGASTGAAFLLLFRLRDDERLALGRLDLFLVAIEIVVVGLWLASLASGGRESRAAVALFLGGPYTVSFWTLVFAVGLATPLAAEWLERRHGVVPGRVAPVLVLIGGLALRWILVSAGQSTGWAIDVALH